MLAAIVDKSGEVTLYAGSTSAAILWGLQISDVGVIVSTLIAALGFAVHVWAQVRKERREQERHRLLMETLINGTAKIDLGGRESDAEGS